MRFGSTAKVLAECKHKYYRISECSGQRLAMHGSVPWNVCWLTKMAAIRCN